VVGGLIAARLLDHDEQTTRTEEPQFTMVYPAKIMHPAEPLPGELQRFEGRRGKARAAVSVRPLELEPYAGDAAKALLPAFSETYRDRIEAGRPRFRLIEEGKANVLGAPGWQLQYRSGPVRRRAIAQDVLLLPDDEGSDGGVILSFRLVKTRGRLSAAGHRLRKAARSTFRSFRFGTERP
jgi:hypothetical protein